MLKTAVFCFSVPVVIFASANLKANETEVIEVLAPKGQLLLSTSNQANASIEEAFSFNLNRTIADHLVTLPGVSLNGQGGQFQSYSIRGFSRSRIRTEVDGIPIITDRRAGNSVSFIAPELLSSGQVIKGPSSAIYGSQALGGVVSLNTQMSDESSVKVEGQLNNQAMNLVWKSKNNGLSRGFAYQKSENETAANGVELNTEFERVSGVVRYQHQGDDLTTIISWLPSYGQDIGKSNNKFQLKEVSQYPEEIHSLTQVQISSISGWSAKLFHHYQNWDSETIRLEQYNALSKYQSHTLGGQWINQLLFEMFEGLALDNFDSYLGVDYLARKGVKINSRYDLLNSNPETNVSLIANKLEGSEDNLALYNKSSWSLGKANLSYSLRYDWIKQQGGEQQSDYDSQLNASFSIKYPLTESMNMELDIANGFRYPTLSERFFNGSTPRGFIQGNESLKPETSVGSQLVVNWQGYDNLSVYSAVYYYDLENYIERYRIDDEMLSYRNLTSASIYGFETELRWYQSDYVEHHFSYQQQAGEDKHSNTLDDLNPTKLSWTVIMEYGSWSFANSLIHYLKMDEVGGSESPRSSFELWNVSFEYQLSDKQTVDLIINNLTDQNYSASLDEDAALQPERSFRLSTTIRF